MTLLGHHPLLEPQAAPEHCVCCFDTLVAELGPPSPRQARPGPSSVADGLCPLFVTWNKVGRSGEPRLRGCIGTLEPKPLSTAVRDYALTSALRDRRFAPIERHELPHLSCTVSLLCGFERLAPSDLEGWEVGVHGLLLEFVDPASGARRTATFLPEVARHQGWGKWHTLEQLVRKAGYAGPAETVLRGGGVLRLTRYRSTTCTLSYQQYLRLKEAGGDAAPGSPGKEAGSPQQLPAQQAAQQAQQRQQQQPFHLGAGSKSRRLVSVPA